MGAKSIKNFGKVTKKIATRKKTMFSYFLPSSLLILFFFP